jgi:hypothetical protein
VTAFPASPEARPGGERARGPGCKMAAGMGGGERERETRRPVTWWGARQPL